MNVLCIRTYICGKSKEILYTTKKKYKFELPHVWQSSIIYAWVLDNNNEWHFFTKKDFFKYFEEIETTRNKIIDGILN
jgi:hypothetical protein